MAKVTLGEMVTDRKIESSKKRKRIMDLNQELEVQETTTSTDAPGETNEKKQRTEEDTSEFPQLEDEEEIDIE